MQWIRFAILVLLATLLQAALANRNIIKPDLLLVMMCFFAIYCDTTTAIITSFVIGFAADVIAIGSPMGPHMISFGFFGTLLAYLHRIIAIRKMPSQAAGIFIISFLTGICVNLLTKIKGQPYPANIYSLLFWTALYSGLIGPFLFLPTAWWMRIKTHRFNRH